MTPPDSRDDLLSKVLSDIRSSDWMVAVHNDYWQDGQRMTFWLFTHRQSRRFVKGEGASDLSALSQVAEQIGLRP
jgi:hypothetical protein